MKIILSLIIAGFMFSCTNGDKTKIEVEPVLNHKLEIVDSLIFNNTDTMFIGQVRSIVMLKDNIFLSDISTSNIKVFDEKMRYLNTIGRYGNGPNEFKKAPNLISKNDSLYAYYGPPKRIFVIDSNQIIVDIIKLDKYVEFSPQSLVVGNKNILINSPSDDPLAQSKLSNIYTSIILDKNYNEIKKIDNYLPEVYDANMNSMFHAFSGTNVFMSNGFKNSFIIHQRASTIWSEYSEDGELLNKYYYKPKYYKTPTIIDKNYKFNSKEEQYEKYISQITFFDFLLFDEINRLLYVTYLNFDKNYQPIYYVFVIKEQGECLFDEPIPGYLADVADGYIYIVTEESPERFVMLKCQLVKK